MSGSHGAALPAARPAGACTRRTGPCWRGGWRGRAWWPHPWAAGRLRRTTRPWSTAAASSEDARAGGGGGGGGGPARPRRGAAGPRAGACQAVAGPDFAAASQQLLPADAFSVAENGSRTRGVLITAQWSGHMSAAAALPPTTWLGAAGMAAGSPALPCSPPPAGATSCASTPPAWATPCWATRCTHHQVGACWGPGRGGQSCATCWMEGRGASLAACSCLCLANDQCWLVCRPQNRGGRVVCRHGCPARLGHVPVGRRAAPGPPHDRSPPPPPTAMHLWARALRGAGTAVQSTECMAAQPKQACVPAAVARSCMTRASTV